MIAIGATGEWLPFYANVVTSSTVRQFDVSVAGIYRALMEAFLPYLAGAGSALPIPMRSLIEPELCALAAKVSWEEGDREVSLAELGAREVSYDGRVFAAAYRRQKYPETR